MMLTHVLLCSLLVQPVLAPPPLLESFYVEHYGCRPRPATEVQLREHFAPAMSDAADLATQPRLSAATPMGNGSPPASAAAAHGGEPAIASDRAATVAAVPLAQALAVQDIGSYFPAQSSWWPLFTPAQVGQEAFQQFLAAGAKPGMLLPDHPLALLKPGTLWRYRQAARAGAIPVQTVRRHHNDDFAARASFAAALGLRPLAALAVDGWSDNLRAAGPGTYLVDHRATSGYLGLPLPARHNQLEGGHFYHAGDQLPRGGGFAVLIDPAPPDELALATLVYPVLGLSWHYADTPFRSNLEGLQTSAWGHGLAASTLLSVPVALFFARPWPDVLLRLGTSISWIWLFIGGGVLLFLATAGLRRLRRAL